MSRMPSSAAHVETDRPSPYLKQLCKHFGHKTEVSFDDEHGRIALPSGGTCTLRADGRELELVAAAETPADLARVEQVIGSHLERFGRRDGLAVAWSTLG